jgi:hypothetical protein
LKILITGGKNIQAIKLVRAYPNDELVLADYGETPSFAASNYRFISLGERNDEILAHHLLTVALDEEVEAIMPLYEAESIALAKAKLLFEEFNIAVILPSADLMINENDGD